MTRKDEVLLLAWAHWFCDSGGNKDQGGAPWTPGHMEKERTQTILGSQSNQSFPYKGKRPGSRDAANALNLSAGLPHLPPLDGSDHDLITVSLTSLRSVWRATGADSSSFASHTKHLSTSYPFPFP